MFSLDLGLGIVLDIFFFSHDADNDNKHVSGLDSTKLFPSVISDLFCETPAQVCFLVQDMPRGFYDETLNSACALCATGS